MKTFDRKDIYSWSNQEDAKQYIGKKGYFGDSLVAIQYEIENERQYQLLEIFSDLANCFSFQYETSKVTGFLFLPADKVKEQKKWRAFRTFEEFVLVVGLIGCHIRYRFKNDISNEFFAVIVGFNYKAQSVTINNHIYSFTELFKKFEFYKNHKWQPFGVEE